MPQSDGVAAPLDTPIRPVIQKKRGESGEFLR